MTQWPRPAQIAQPARHKPTGGTAALERPNRAMLLDPLTPQNDYRVPNWSKPFLPARQAK
jgi:hypothetical protein